MSDIDKRAHRRLALEIDAWVCEAISGVWQPIRMLDISVGGAGLVVPQQLDVGAHYAFQFQIPDQAERIHMIGRVMYCVPHSYLGGFRTGVKISKIEARDHAAIARYTGDPLPPVE